MSNSIEQQKLYWHQKLEQLPILDIPFGHVRPPSQSFIKAKKSMTFERDTYLKIENFCLQKNTSLFKIILCTLKILFLRYTRQEDIIVGSLSSDSYREINEGEYQSFLNPVILRTKLTEFSSFNDILDHTEQTIEEVKNNLDYPFDDLVEHTQANERLDYFLPFQAILIPLNLPFAFSKKNSQKKKFFWWLIIFPDVT